MDLSAKDSLLRRIIMGESRDVNRDSLAQSLADAFNSHASPDEIAQLISTVARGMDIQFTYTKPNGDSETRRVSVKGIAGDSIRARDHKDGHVKNFRLDRISQARESSHLSNHPHDNQIARVGHDAPREGCYALHEVERPSTRMWPAART